MPKTYEIVVGGDGTHTESKPYVWDFAAQLAELGSGFTLTGTPVIQVQPDSNLTVGAPALSTDATAVQATVTATAAAAQTGSYHTDCWCVATDGVKTFDLIVRGNLTVTQVT